MAISANAVTASWNPLRCGGTALPTNLLLMAKLIALCLLLTNHVRLIPDPFLPFVPAFDWIGAPAAFQTALQVAFVAAAVALLLNRWVRASCLALGGVILIGVVSSKAYYGNNKTFCGLILFLTGLYEPGSEPWLLRAQFALVYFGAGLNKLLDADWRSGLFMENWATARLKHGAYIAVASSMPPMLLAKLMCWGTVVTELGMSAAFLIAAGSRPGSWPACFFNRRFCCSPEQPLRCLLRYAGGSAPVRRLATVAVARDL